MKKKEKNICDISNFPYFYSEILKKRLAGNCNLQVFLANTEAKT